MISDLLFDFGEAVENGSADHLVELKHLTEEMSEYISSPDYFIDYNEADRTKIEEYQKLLTSSFTNKEKDLNILVHKGYDLARDLSSLPE